jgi:glycerol uptake facilitator-like aquaporin
MLSCLQVYTAANISGGHLNPAVTISTLLCGFYPVLHSVLYITLQVRSGHCNADFDLIDSHEIKMLRVGHPD